MNYQRFLTKCGFCGSTTSRAYAIAHDGKCKTCATGILSKPRVRADMLCPDCGERELTPYQKRNHYHCDACTRQADPEGYRMEVMGLSEPSGGDY